ncbi:MAG: alpha-glucosidase C-terminal domain-containing protein, partial [Streptococcus salivarius]
SALANPDSIFYTYQKLVELRKTQDWLIDADFELLETTDKVFAYIRKTKDSSYLVVVNLSDQEQDFDYDFDVAEVVIANTELKPIADQGKLQAWDAICVKVK